VRTGLYDEVRAAYNIEITPRGRALGLETAHHNDSAQRPTPGAESAVSSTGGFTAADWRFAKLAIEEAEKSVSEGDGRVHPKVGVVVVRDDRVLGVAHRGEIPSCHAEFIVLERKLAETSIVGATVYTTLEPCTKRNHPKVPCAQRLAERKVARVVIGMFDPNPDITTHGQQILRDANIITDVFPHELMCEVEDLNRDFKRMHRTTTGSGAPKVGTPLPAVTLPTPSGNRLEVVSEPATSQIGRAPSPPIHHHPCDNLSLRLELRGHKLVGFLENLGIAAVQQCSAYIDAVEEWIPELDDFRKIDFSCRVILGTQRIGAGEKNQSASAVVDASPDGRQLRMPNDEWNITEFVIPREGTWRFTFRVLGDGTGRQESHFIEWRCGQPPRLVARPQLSPAQRFANRQAALLKEREQERDAENDIRGRKASALDRAPAQLEALKVLLKQQGESLNGVVPDIHFSFNEAGKYLEAGKFAVCLEEYQGYDPFRFGIRAGLHPHAMQSMAELPQITSSYHNKFFGAVLPDQSFTWAAQGSDEMYSNDQIVSEAIKALEDLIFTDQRADR
jgi:pyrimidine deaminase RibD-like protein